MVESEDPYVDLEACGVTSANPYDTDQMTRRKKRAIEIIKK